MFETKTKLKGQSIDASNVGRFAVFLARCSFFGDDVLQVLTLKCKGKGNRHGLDCNKLESMLSEIQIFPDMDKDEFSSTIQLKVE